MRIVLVEDDGLYVEALSDAMKSRWPEVEIRAYSSEQEFRSSLPVIASFNPDIVIIDVVLKWTVPSKSMPNPPPEVIRDGRFRAGIRCRELLAREPATRLTPAILYTVLERKDIQDDLIAIGVPVVHVPKSSSIGNLFRHIETMMKSSSS